MILKKDIVRKSKFITERKREMGRRCGQRKKKLLQSKRMVDRIEKCTLLWNFD